MPNLNYFAQLIKTITSRNSTSTIMKRHLFSFILLALSVATFAQDITLEDIWKNGRFRGTGVWGLNSMADGEHYTKLDRTSGGFDIVKYRYDNGNKVGVIASATEIEAAGISDFSEYEFSSDEKKILFTTEDEPIYRHSVKAIFYLYDVAAKTAQKLSDEKIMLATFSPTGDAIAYVKSNNMYVKNLSTGVETAITTDGEWNKIINGACDWVYEEEFGFDKAFQWSPDGKRIAYYRFDESKVKEFSMDMFEGNLYPSQYRFKYPKAGEANSTVEIWIYDVVKDAKVKAKTDRMKDFYVPRIRWTENPEVLCITVMNRHQNVLDLYKVNARSGELLPLLHEEAPAYMEVHDHLTFFKDGSFLWTSEQSGYNHIYLYSKDGALIRQLTTGNYDVTNVYGLDAKNNIYYQAAESSPINREIFSIDLNGKKKTKLSLGQGMLDADFSNGMKYFILTKNEANRAPRYELCNSTGKMLRVLEDNAKMQESLDKANLGKKEFFQFTTGKGEVLNGWMIKPANFDPTKKYPLLMYVYGGPGSQTVQNNYGGANELWYHMLAQKGYIVASVDNRGTGARGRDFRTITYQELGKFETNDQIEAAMYLGGLNYIDESRIGIWGWSYGGYMTSLCLTKGADYFKMGIAVAPVTNWRYYDSIYTERYMRLPQENASGYDNNSPINHVDKLRGKYLLVHGSADDNVHYQNTMEMINALVAANKQFDLFIYPDKNHGIYGGNTRLHLYQKMTDYILENL